MTGDQAAVISPCGQYRYVLRRGWLTSDAAVVCFVMLNPSTADAALDDPTIRRCIRFAQDWGFGQLAVVNLFALRATDPGEISSHPNPVGPLNDMWIDRVVGDPRVEKVVAAWGNHGSHRGRGDSVMQRLRAMKPVHAFAITGLGEPIHPLYQPATKQTGEFWPALPPIERSTA